VERISWSRGIFAVLLITFGYLLPATANAGECAANAYASDTSAPDAYPLAKPSAELSKTLNAAQTGNVLEQRNLAASYESGYRVSKCLEKAAYWYRRAAKGGDDVAKTWVANRDMLDNIAAGPECLGSGCYFASSGGPQIMSLVADSAGHFHSRLAINGVEVDGMIDTGATNIAISAATAAQMGIPLAGSTAGGAMTANGVIPTLSKIIPIVRIGNIELENVEISITPNSPTLIGMSVLRRLKISAANGQMTLSK